MHPALPAEVEVIDLPDGIRYRLPPRDLGPRRFLGLPVIAFGLFGCAFVSFWLWGVILSLPWGGNGFDIVGVVFLLFGFLVGLGPLSMVAVGLFILAGRSEIELRGGTLRAIERCGPIRWSWKRPLARL